MKWKRKKASLHFLQLRMFYVIGLLTLPYPNTLPNLRIFLNLSMCTLIKNCFITKDLLSVNATQKRLISMQSFCKDKNAMNLNKRNRCDKSDLMSIIS